MTKPLLLSLMTVASFLLVGCGSSSPDEGGAAVTTKPANFRAAEGSAAGGGAPAGPTGQGGAGDRPGAAAPPGP